jgi:hypothetical protein
VQAVDVYVDEGIEEGIEEGIVVLALAASRAELG